MSEFFEEVKEELRQEQLLKLWHKYQVPIIALVVAFFVVTAGIIYWQNHVSARNVRQAEAFSTAVALGQSGQLDDAMTQLEALSQESGSTYPLLAKFRLVALRVTRHFVQQRTTTEDLDKAIATLSEIERSGADEVYTGMAQLARHYLTLAKESPEAVSKDIKNLQDPKNPWHFLVRELLILSNLQSGQKDSAHALANELASELAAPMNLRQRANMLTETTASHVALPSTAHQTQE